MPSLSKLKKKIAMLRGGLYYMGAVNLSNISQSFSLLFVTKYWYKVPNIQNNLLLESDHKGQKFHKYQNLPEGGVKVCGFALFLVRFCGNLHFKLRYFGFPLCGGLRFV